MDAEDIVTAPVHTVRADVPLGAAVELLEREPITTVPVVGERDVLVATEGANAVRVPARSGAHRAGS